MRSLWTVQYQDYDDSWRQISSLVGRTKAYEIFNLYKEHGVNGHMTSVRLIEFVPRVVTVAEGS